MALQQEAGGAAKSPWFCLARGKGAGGAPQPWVRNNVLEERGREERACVTLMLGAEEEEVELEVMASVEDEQGAARMHKVG
eukprot:1228135-Rhodomonas_salina.1